MRPQTEGAGHPRVQVPVHGTQRYAAAPDRGGPRGDQDAIAPLVTVVIATFNAGGTLRACIESVLDQPCPRIELIIIDGSSTDRTVDIIREYDDAIAFWASEPDRGVYDAMNKGTRHGSGGWYYFLGADDTLAPGFSAALERITDPSTIYYGDVWMPRRGVRYDGEFSPIKLTRRNICHQSIFYPRRVWDTHAYDLSYPVMADYALNLVCFADPDLKFAYLPEVVAVFEDAQGLSQSRLDPAFEADKLSLISAAVSRQVYARALVWHWGLRVLKSTGLFRIAWLLKATLKRRAQRVRTLSRPR